jgi:UDP-N-acetylmuramoyl-L-alanyl-D-glutamate--2,6-diaminopimelate ligase
LIKHKFQKIKNIYHLGQAILANFIYGNPAKNIKIIGVTGTNGKTTTVWMIGKILEEAGFKVAINSTINFQIGAKKWVNNTKFTTLSSFAVQKFIKEAVKEGCDYLVLETSSHSLDQFRVWGIPYNVAVITNVTREHLDYHQTMEEYRKAKLRLFKKAETIVVNLDMGKPEEFLQFDNKNKIVFTCHPELVSGSNKITCLPAGRDSGSEAGMTIVTAEDIELGINYSSYKLQTTNYKLNLPGKFNIENALAATCVGLSQNISLEVIRKALEKIQGIPGRMEWVPNNKGLNIIIDYAVTPDSLEKLYSLINQIKCHSHESGNPENKDWVPNQVRDGNNKIIAVFGACGERDRGKRPIMGEIVAQYADYIILTNEDPYGEDPQRIIDEIFSGVVKHKKESVDCWRVIDRREAIRRSLILAQPGDFVVLTGKGAEETMAIGKNKIPWKEKEVVQEELDKL